MRKLVPRVACFFSSRIQAPQNRCEEMELDRVGQESDLEGDRDKEMQKASHRSSGNLSWVERKVEIGEGDGECTLVNGLRICRGSENFTDAAGFLHRRQRRTFWKEQSIKRHKIHEFDSWIWKISWRRAWQPTPVFLPGESHGQRSLADYSLWGCKESGMTEAI